ncbi:hypothetical protein EV356DRAFT_382827 [Viridothelium virens]|uniref:Uncharacterized protein n=1 Tax=Viridothelium virens TaxID=1048519 RepID=A0A6A6HI78_VIRVR|nr:hypothetical protein EV356DRAFT_382827 [Viridothelium virens]
MPGLWLRDPSARSTGGPAFGRGQIKKHRGHRRHHRYDDGFMRGRAEWTRTKLPRASHWQPPQALPVPCGGLAGWCCATTAGRGYISAPRSRGTLSAIDITWKRQLFHCAALPLRYHQRYLAPKEL